MPIEIIAKYGKIVEVVDDASNKKEAKASVDYWKAIKGKGWHIFTKVKNNHLTTK